MVSVTLYVEGAGSSYQKAACRQAFKIFFERAGLQGRLPRVFPKGSRNDAYRYFCSALEQAGKDDFLILLVDAESAVRPGVTGWDHLGEEDGWVRPPGAGDDQVHLMVQCMEAWFLADRDGLIAYCGRDFNTRALPKQSNVEAISKQALFEGLASATKKTKKGEYHKGADSSGILAKLDPDLVCKASPHARRLVDVLRQKL